MPDTRLHRGPHPEDAKWFASSAVPLLRRAVDDYSLLLSRGYATTSALKLVGDHHLLSARQRLAVMRCSCSAQSKQLRAADELLLDDASGRRVVLDGYNVLTTVEAALAGAVLLVARDGCLRDLASMHGSWRRVAETAPAVHLIGRTLAKAGITTVSWLLDSPVSNSGRLKSAILAVAREEAWPWDVELVPSPDAVLKKSLDVVATADSVILDICPHWLNLARYVVREHIPKAWLIDLSETTSAVPRE